MPEPFSWSELYRRRRETAAQFGPIFGLRIVRRVREVLLSCVANGDHVLEVGAGDRSMGQALLAARSDVVYRSLDIDPHGKHDYRQWSEVDESFDVVFAFEVIEHLPLEEIPGWLQQMANLLRPGGRLLLSTPNTFYPPAYLRDATHRTPLCYDELAGLVSGTGLQVEQIVRIYHDPLHRKLLRRYVFGWLFRLIGIDFARQIVLVARR
ncbi:MAG: class I SAM-dependent methyltransferase [Pirellulales bacterium]